MGGHELQLEDVPGRARPYFEKELAEMTHAEKIVKTFHQYLRDKVAIKSGSVVDYVQAAHEMLVENRDPENVTHSRPTIDHLKRMVAVGRNDGGD